MVLYYYDLIHNTKSINNHINIKEKRRVIYVI